jgi:protein ImuB
MLKKQNGVRVFASDREKFEVSTMHGPERLVGEWWDEKPHQRDYFRVETKNGQHLWVFRNGSGVMSEFYLHGYFD